MNRRHVIEGFMGLVGLPLGFTARSFAQPTAPKAIRVAVDTRKKQGRIADDFTGLGYEISSVATPGLVSA
jgi:hypothetical protein